MFQDNISIPSSGGQAAWPLEIGLIGYPKMQVLNYQSTLCNIPQEWRFHSKCGRSLQVCKHTWQDKSTSLQQWLVETRNKSYHTRDFLSGGPRSTHSRQRQKQIGRGGLLFTPVFMVYLTILSVSQTNVQWQDDYWITNWEGCREKQSRHTSTLF